MEIRLNLRSTLAAALLLPAAGCAVLPPEIPEAAECRANFLGLDESVEAAGVRDGGAHAIPGFPYLRSDRFLASFRREAADGEAFDTWVEHLRRLDLRARGAELRNLGWDDPSEELRHLDRCGRDWAARDLADPRRRALLRENAAVPDDYSLLKRTLGLYPLAAFFLNIGIGSFNEDVQEDYATPLGELKSGGPLVLWEPIPPAVGAPSGATGSPRGVGAPSGATGATGATGPWARDALGIPMLTDDDLRALAAVHAPRWLVETAGDFDRIGAPVLKAGQPSLDTARPVTWFLPAHTRFGGEVLVQLVYVAWFSERPKSGSLDPYGGTLDGVVWRVTLDAAGEPLLYDTIHACGCYHYYYVPERAQALERRRQGGFWDEPVLFPQQAPATPFAIRLHARTHYVRRLVPLADVAASQVALYESADYAELLSLPDGAGGRRSLFREDGLVRGTGRLERFFLWPAGIKSAGAMRQWGRHATSFVGRSHFDDPRMLDRLFEPQ
jgi:hypothetical protein